MVLHGWLNLLTVKIDSTHHCGSFDTEYKLIWQLGPELGPIN